MKKILVLLLMLVVAGFMTVDAKVDSEKQAIKATEK